MQTTMTLEAALEQKLGTTFELVDQRNSGYHMKGTEHKPNPISLRSSKLNLLTMTSEVCLGKGKGYAKIQYVPNAPTIFIEDMWRDDVKGTIHSMGEKEQKGWSKQLGLKSLGYDLKAQLVQAKEMKIGFVFGLLSLDKFGGDPTLLTYIHNHHLNEDRPNVKDDTKQHTGLFKFRCVKMDQKAEAQLENLDKELLATEYVNSLRTKQGNGYVYTELNKKKIDATLRILDLNAGVQPEEYSRKHLLLNQYAKANPVQFIKFIDDAFDQYRVEIGKAVGYNVLEIADKSVNILTEDGEKKSKTTKILTLKSDTNDTKMEELIIHFVTDAGIVDYKNMLMQMTFASGKN